MAIVTSPTGNTTPAAAIAGAPDWRTAVTDLLAWFVANDRCFSSGEVAAYLRTYRPDLRFSATGIGEFIRDAYDAGTFPSYDVVDPATGASAPLYPTQVPRTCTGVARTLDGRIVQAKTPVGQSVFVYAKDGADGFAHDFEVYVPEWDDPQALKATPVGQAAPVNAAPTPTGQPTPAAPVQIPSPQANVIIGRLPPGALVAKVRSDRRLIIERSAFEAFVSLTGTPLRGGPQGDPVHVSFDVDATGKSVAMVTRDPRASSTPYHLWNGAGRVAFLASGSVAPFTPDDKYKVEIVPATATEPAAIVIDLSATI